MQKKNENNKYLCFYYLDLKNFNIFALFASEFFLEIKYDRTGTAEVPFIFLSPFYSPLSLTRDFSCYYYDLGLFCFYTCTAYVPIHK